MKNLFQLSKFPPVVQLLVLIMLFLIGGLLQGLMLPILGITNLKAAGSTQVLLLMVSTQLCSFILPAIAFIALLPKKVPNFLLMKPIENPLDIFKLILLSVFTIVAVLGVSQLMLQLPLGSLADQMQQERKGMENAALQMDHWQQLLIRLFVMALLPAIGEEFFFRGVFQRFMYTFIKKPLLAILATSLVFALFHGSVYNMLPITLAGVILGAVYYYSGNIWYSIILHFLVNGIQVVITFFQKNNTSEENLPMLYAVLFAVVGIAAIFAIIKSIKKGKVSSKADWMLPYEPMFK